MVPGRTNVSLTLSWSTDYDPIAAAQQPGAGKQGPKGDADSEVMLLVPRKAGFHHNTSDNSNNFSNVDSSADNDGNDGYTHNGVRSASEFTGLPAVASFCWEQHCSCSHVIEKVSFVVYCYHTWLSYQMVCISVALINVCCHEVRQ